MDTVQLYIIYFSIYFIWILLSFHESYYHFQLYQHLTTNHKVFTTIHTNYFQSYFLVVLFHHLLRVPSFFFPLFLFFFSFAVGLSTKNTFLLSERINRLTEIRKWNFLSKTVITVISYKIWECYANNKASVMQGKVRQSKAKKKYAKYVLKIYEAKFLSHSQWLIELF